jgi:hypothetical protein
VPHQDLETYRMTERVRSVALAALITAATALPLSGCGGLQDKVTESAIERAIESESGGNVNFDLNGDGGFSFESDEGSIRFGEDGSFTIVDENGQVFAGESSEEGFVVQGEDGAAIIDVDPESGAVSFQGQDGQGSVRSGPGVPQEWPVGKALPPAGLVDVTGTVIEGDGQMFISVTGTVAQGARDYLNAYGSALEGGGYERTSYFESDGYTQATYESAEYTVSVVADDANDRSSVTVTLTTTT